MNILKTIKEFKIGFMDSIKLGVEIDQIKKRVKKAGTGYTSHHIGNVAGTNIPVFIADEFVFVTTKIRGAPSAYCVVLSCGTREIYVNDMFTKLSVDHQNAVLQHEVGHLVTNALYTARDRLLENIGLSNKCYLAECIADDYAVANGYDMLGTLITLRDTYGIGGAELDKRIARLKKGAES